MDPYTLTPVQNCVNVFPSKKECLAFLNPNLRLEGIPS